jgi:hypothetical protein
MSAAAGGPDCSWAATRRSRRWCQNQREQRLVLEVVNGKAALGAAGTLALVAWAAARGGKAPCELCSPMVSIS